MPHEEAIQKIKQEVIPLLKKAKSHLVENSAYVPEFEKLHSYISAFFPEKQAVRTEQTGRTQKMLQLLDELRRLVDQSDV
jgi:regulator of replication initiation timing